MIKLFESNIVKNQLFDKKDRLLLAFSGGIDSVVLAHLLKACGFKFELAHCNFKLRGKESEGDKNFCKALAKQMGVEIHCTDFNTRSYAKKNGLSLQMAARKLRYDWFMELVKEYKFNYVLTAHHGNDNVETLLVNLVRGTGIKGLQGIPVKQNHLVRPLLFSTKEQIITYAKKNKLKYRSDSSNDEVKYKRNFLRHEIIPKLKSLNPSLESTFENNIRLFNQSARVVRSYISAKRKQFITQKNDQTIVRLTDLQKEENKDLLMHEWLSPFGYSSSQIEQILENADQKTSGKIFNTPTHKGVINRAQFIIEPLNRSDPENEFLIREIKDLKKLPFTIIYDLKGGKIVRDKMVGQIDYDKLNFPITVRKWRQGDKFRPLGMTGFKKLSDFFINRKLSLFEKEDVWVLCNGDDIVWVIGQRIDDRYKITGNTKKILKLVLSE